MLDPINEESNIKLYLVTEKLNIFSRYPCRFEGMPVRSSTAADRAQLLSICQHCRLAKCRQAGMRDEYVHNLRFGRIERKSKKLLGNGNFRSVLDPGQTNLLDLFQTFWR